MDLRKFRKNYLISLFKENLRKDGRTFFDYRGIKVRTNIIENAEGSAYVELGNTKVLCGIKIEVVEPFPEFPDEGIVVTNLDLTPISDKEIPPELIPIEAELGRVVDRGIRESKLVDTKKLVIERGKWVWDILIDIAILDYDGNVIDASGIAAYLALKNAVFPKLEKVEEKYRINYKERTNEKLPITKLVLPITFAKIGDYLILDPNKEEEEVADVIFTIGRDRNFVYSLQKSRDGFLTKEDVEKALEISKRKFEELEKIINKNVV
jgi:exosome complex component RRP42